MTLFVRFLYLFFAFLVLSESSFSQKRADELYEQYDYINAAKIYKRKAGNNVTSLIKLADCYTKIKDYKNAELTYQKIINSGNEFPETVHFKYAQILSNNKNYDEAQKQLEIYHQKKPTDKLAKLFSKSFEDIKVWYDLPQGFEVNQVNNINTKFSDFGAVDYKGGAVFVSERSEDFVGETKDISTKHPYLNVFYAKQKDSTHFKKSHLFSNTIIGDYHTGPLSFSTDQEIVAYTKVESISKKKNVLIRPKIFFAKKRGNDWGKEEPFYLNSDDYSVEHPSLSFDGNTLYFASDMPGGYGGSDIYYCKKQDGNWGKAVNLGANINSPLDEFFPYVASNNVLYYSSNGLGGLGGLDLFSTFFLNGKWVTPLNLKAPINSSYDDFGISFHLDGFAGYFSSNRPGGRGGDDIYGFKVNKHIVNIQGHLLTDRDTSHTIPNATVALVDGDGKVLQQTKSDSTGYFRFENIKSDQYYVVKISDSDEGVLKFKKKVYISDENNKIVRFSVVSSDGSFEFKNIPPDLSVLPLLEEDDSGFKPMIISGKVVSGKDTLTPIANVKINLVNKEKEIAQTRVSDKDGAFEFVNLKADEDYLLQFDESADAVLKYENQIFIKDKKGKVILNAQRNTTGRFVFDLLANDKTTLALMEEDDGQFKMDLKGKLISGEADKTPIANARVIMLNEKGEMVQSTRTDSRGNFRFANLPSDQNYIIKTDENDTATFKYKKISITNENGKVIFSAAKGNKGDFEFRMLSTDRNRLELIEEQDEVLTTDVRGTLKSNDGVNIVGAKIILADASGRTMQYTLTDDNGVFKFQKLGSDQKYIFKIDENDPALTFFNSVVLYDAKGNEIFKADKKQFKFDFIAGDKTALAYDEEEDSDFGKVMRGKILSEEGVPLANVPVLLKDKDGSLIQKSTTNSNGDFVFRGILNDKNYLLTVDESDTSLSRYNTIVMQDSKGNEILRSTKNNFKFNFLPSEKVPLAFLEEDDDASVFKNFKGKLLQSNGKLVIGNTDITIVDEKGNVIARGKTDANGNFEFKNLPSDKNYLVVIDDDELEMNGLILADEKGKPVKKGYMDKDGKFKFIILTEDQSFLAVMSEEDSKISLPFTSEKLENVYFSVGKFTLDEQESKKLDNVVKFLKTFTDIAIEVSSHADARSSAAFNLTLTKKRTDAIIAYMVRNGVNKKQLIGKYYGEQKLLNKCVDGAVCTEDEHKVNRRTEFKPIKRKK